jgi:hypothetical protein
LGVGSLKPITINALVSLSLDPATSDSDFPLIVSICPSPNPIGLLVKGSLLTDNPFDDRPDLPQGSSGKYESNSTTMIVSSH